MGFLSRKLDFDLLRREAERRQLEIAIVSPDPERRALARGCGFPTFASVEEAQTTAVWSNRPPRQVAPPPRYWWEEDVELQPRSSRPRPWLEWIKQGMRFGAFLLVIVALASSASVVIPSAEVTIVPAGRTFTTIVPVSVDPEIETVEQNPDGPGGTVPARRVGVEVENYAEVETSGTANVAAGIATGEVMFTSLLAQDYNVPAGTVVRTSSTSYPIRFRTTADVVVPAGSQATVPIEALEKGTGNIAAYQINQIEGVAASAVRVINPGPTRGAEPEEVPVVSQADYDRVRERLTDHLLDQAYGELGALLEPTEFLPRQSLRIEAVPKKAYTHFIGEQADKVGLNMRLLVSGQAVDVGNAKGLAYAALAQRLPPGYALVDTHFELGEVAEEDIGSGWFTVFVTARGYAAAALNTEKAIQHIQGKPISEARQQLETAFPLAETPQITLWPDWPKRLTWLKRLPLLSLRINVQVLPRGQAAAKVD